MILTMFFKLIKLPLIDIILEIFESLIVIPFTLSRLNKLSILFSSFVFIPDYTLEL